MQRWVNEIRLLLWVASISLLCAGTVVAHETNDTIIIFPSADTTIFEGAATNNLGGSIEMIAGTTGVKTRGRSLIRFPVFDSLPSNSVISTVALTVTVVAGPAADNAPNPVMTLHRLLRPWGEGTKSGSFGELGTTNEATWINRFSPSGAWDVAGGKEGVDYVAIPSGSITVSNLGSYTFDSTPELYADVNGWLQAPASNFGWLLRAEDESILRSARRFATREAPTNGPALSINFIHFHSETAVEKLDFTSGLFLLHLNIWPNSRCTVEASPEVMQNNWLSFTNFSAQPYFRHIVIPDVLPTIGRRFYRVTLISSTNSP